MGGKTGIADLARSVAALLATGCLLLPAAGLAQDAQAAGVDSGALERRIQELEQSRARYEALIEEHERLRQRVEELEREKLARQGTAGEAAAPESRLAEPEPDQLAHGSSEERGERLELLEKRVDELEITKVAQEDATRSIIRQSLSGLGSNINEFVTFGGTLEVLSGWEEDFQRNSDQFLRLNTAELDFEIRVGDWVQGSMILEYNDGADTLFPTTTDDEATVDRLNIDTAFLTLGDVERWWPYASVGRMIVPFGISTGNPVADVLTLNDPLTLEIFESKEDAILVGAAFPTRPLAPPVEIPSPPPVRPLLLQPAISGLARRLGYKPLPTPPPTPSFTTLAPDPPPFSVGVYAYQGDTFDRPSREGEWSPDGQWGATVGYRTKVRCRPLLGRQPGASAETLGWLHAFCPWTIDLDVDYNQSVFDSNLLSFEYQRWLGQIGFVPGMAASLKANLGPVGVVLEWNGALYDATFNDDLRRRIHVKPSAWQVNLSYQFDWNPWVEAIGAQGTYVTLGYSESKDMQGVARLVGGLPERVGFVPEKRFVVGVGEWVTDGLRVAVEYAWVQDYPTSVGGTGRQADGFFTMFTYEW